LAARCGSASITARIFGVVYGGAVMPGRMAGDVPAGPVNIYPPAASLEPHRAQVELSLALSRGKQICGTCLRACWSVAPARRELMEELIPP